jgi:hypothetical protein
VARRCVWSRNIENEAKARYRAVKIQQQWVLTPGKQTNKHISLTWKSCNISAVVSDLPGHVTPCKKSAYFLRCREGNFLPIFCTSITAYTYFANARIRSTDNVLFMFEVNDIYSVLACSSYFVYVHKGMKQKGEHTKLQRFPSQRECCFRLQQNVYIQFSFFCKGLRNWNLLIRNSELKSELEGD